MIPIIPFRLGNYRMPFAWAARPLFRLYSNELDTSSDFPAIYRQENNKIKDEELLKLLSEYRKYVLIHKRTRINFYIIQSSMYVLIELFSLGLRSLAN